MGRGGVLEHSEKGERGRARERCLNCTHSMGRMGNHGAFGTHSSEEAVATTGRDGSQQQGCLSGIVKARRQDASQNLNTLGNSVMKRLGNSLQCDSERAPSNVDTSHTSYSLLCCFCQVTSFSADVQARPPPSLTQLLRSSAQNHVVEAYHRKWLAFVPERHNTHQLASAQARQNQNRAARWSRPLDPPPGYRPWTNYKVLCA